MSISACDVRADDERVLAAQLEVHARHATGGALGDPRAGADAPGERDAVDALVVHDPLADVATAGQQRHEAGREVVHARRERQRRERRELRRLAQSGVAGGEHGRELPGQQEQRVVPRHDAGDEPERLLQHERELRGLDRRDHPALRAARQLGIEVERARRPADLVAVLDQRLATLAGHQLGQLFRAGAQPRGDLVQRLRALGGRGRGPLALGAAGGLDRGVELRRVGRADGHEALPEGGILDREGRPGTFHQLPTDQQSRLHERDPASPPRRGPGTMSAWGTSCAWSRLKNCRPRGR